MDPFAMSLMVSSMLLVLTSVIIVWCTILSDEISKLLSVIVILYTFISSIIIQLLIRFVFENLTMGV